MVHRYGPDFDKLKIGVIPSIKDTKTAENHNKSIEITTENTKESAPNSSHTALTKPPSLQTTKLSKEGTTSSVAPTTLGTSTSRAGNDTSSRVRRAVSSNPDKVMVQTNYLPLYSKKRNRSIEYYGNVSENCFIFLSVCV